MLMSIDFVLDTRTGKTPVSALGRVVRQFDDIEVLLNLMSVT